jgi:hypothetical protein
MKVTSYVVSVAVVLCVQCSRARFTERIGLWATKCRGPYLTTVSVTSIFTTSPLTLSVAVVY